MAYGIAAAIGVTFVVTIITLRLALGTGIDESFLTGDVTQHIVGQRYFIADAWRWPLLVTRLLEPPQGVNISLTDSIPLAALLTKLFRGMLPAGYTTIYPWLGVAFLLQPIAGVYALRGAGEKRLLPAALVALLALSMPTLLFRVGHIALCSHFLLLFAIGLYLRITADGRGRLGPVLLLLCASLLIHPYLLAMVATVLVAAPITLCLRRAPWAAVAGQVAAALVATAGLALLLGYGGESPGSGFGRASMNLISPVYPFQSFLYQAIIGSPAPRVDATGLQYEGYQYLGAGVLLLLAVMLVTDPRAVGRSIRRHAGPWLIGVALTVLSVSSTAYAGHSLLFRIPHVPEFMHQFRSSGRFFWPVTYFLLIGAVVATLRGHRRWVAFPVLVVATGLQWADATDLRRGITHMAGPHAPLTAEDHLLERVIAQHRRVTIWPTAACGEVASAPPFMRVLRAASVHVVPVNSMYLARESDATHCEGAEIAAAPLAPGELRLFMPNAINAAGAVPDGIDHCRMVGEYAACSRNDGALSGLPALPAEPLFPIGQLVQMGGNHLPPQAVVGWYWAEPEGAWTRGHTAILAGRFVGAGAEPMRLTIWADAVADQPEKAVTVRIDDTVVAHWQIHSGTQREYTAEIPAGLLSDGTHLVRFEIAHPIRTIDFRHDSEDSRLLGLYLMNFRFDPN